MNLSSIIAAEGAALQLGDRLLELYKVKRDGSFYQQQEFLSRLREHEAEVTAERAALDGSANDWRGLEIALSTLSQTDRLNRLLSTNPFQLSSEDTSRLVGSASSEGARPLLLEAPIDVDERASSFAGLKSLDLGISQQWSMHPCASDVQPMAGVIARPLKYKDLDVHRIKDSLPGIPVILIYGRIDADNYLWLTVYAWNIVTKATQQEPLRLAYPKISCTEPLGESSIRYEWKDNILAQATTIIALLAQWFFLVHHGRKPILDKLTQSDDGDGMRGLLARQLATAYEVLASEGESSVGLRLDQAELLVEAGMHAQANVFALSMLDHARNEPQRETDYLLLARLAALLRALGDEGSTAEATELLENRSKTAVYEILGWVG